MAKFKDSEGREWILSLSLGDVLRIKREADANLLEINKGDPPLRQRLDEDVELFVGVLYTAVKPQAEKLNIDPESFACGLDGDAFGEAYDCFWDALIDFFRQSRRVEQAKILAAQRKLQAKAFDQIDEHLAKLEDQISKTMDKAIDRAMEKHLEKTLGDSSSGGQGSSESIHGRFPLVN